MGRAGIRPARALRKTGAGRFPGRAVLDHHPAQAGKFPQSLPQFCAGKIARYGGRDIDRLLKNEGIIRSRAKIEATIKGAKLWIEIEGTERGGFHELIG